MLIQRLTRLRQYRGFISSTIKIRGLSSAPTTPENGDKGENLYDIVIAGGGLVGTALAAALDSNPLFDGTKILLLEGGAKKLIKELPKDYGNRVSTINPAARDLFQGMGVWTKVEKKRQWVVKSMEVWVNYNDAAIKFEGTETHYGDIAYVVENDVLLSAITEVLDETKRVEVMYKAKAKSYKLPPADMVYKPPVKIHLEDGRVLSTRLLVGADGFNSLVRQTMKVRYIKWNHDQMAIVATLQLSDDTISNDTAWQKFLAMGPIALLPLSENQSSLVWTTTPQMAKELEEMSDDDFVEALNDGLFTRKNPQNLLNTCFGAFQQVAKLVTGVNPLRPNPPRVVGVIPKSRASFPLGFGHACQYVTPRAALIGDAAHRCHPLAGQGLNLGFGDVVQLVDSLGAGILEGKEIGCVAPLLKYEQERIRHNLAVMSGIEAIKALNDSRQFLPIELIGSMTLHTIHSFPALKKQIMELASR